MTDRWNDLIKKYNVSELYAYFLNSLENVKVYFILGNTYEQELRRYITTALQFTGASFVTTLNKGDLGFMTSESIRSHLGYDEPDMKAAIPLQHALINVLKQMPRQRSIIVIRSCEISEEAFATFRDQLPPYIFVQIVDCWNNQPYRINSLQMEFTGNFFRERRRVLEEQGIDFPYSYGNYIIQSLTSAIYNASSKLPARSPALCHLM